MIKNFGKNTGRPKTVKEVISFTGAMKNSNCAVNNPKGTCCYQDIVSTLDKYLK